MKKEEMTCTNGCIFFNKDKKWCIRISIPWDFELHDLRRDTNVSIDPEKYGCGEGVWEIERTPLGVVYAKWGYWGFIDGKPTPEQIKEMEQAIEEWKKDLGAAK